MIDLTVNYYVKMASDVEAWWETFVYFGCIRCTVLYEINIRLDGPLVIQLSLGPSGEWEWGSGV